MTETEKDEERGRGREEARCKWHSANAIHKYIKISLRPPAFFSFFLVRHPPREREREREIGKIVSEWGRGRNGAASPVVVAKEMIGFRRHFSNVAVVVVVVWASEATNSLVLQIVGQKQQMAKVLATLHKLLHCTGKCKNATTPQSSELQLQLQLRPRTVGEN